MEVFWDIVHTFDYEILLQLFQHWRGGVSDAVWTVFSTLGNGGALWIALAVILLNGAVFQDVDSIIYGIMFNFIVSAVINKMMFGFSSSMLAMIVTDDGKAACAEIDRVADRGSTILQGHGGYGGQPKDVVLCACSNKQLYEIEHAVQAIDPGCFIIMLQSNEVHGEGFRQLELGKSESSENK